MDSLSCELVGLNLEKFCCLEVHSAIYRELLLGGAKCLFHGIQEKLKRCPPVDCGPHRAPNKSSARRS